MLYTRGQMAFNLISAPYREDIAGGGYTLPLVPASQTRDPQWLADLIEHATNDDGQLLTPAQLMTCLDFMNVWWYGYEPDAPFWEIAAERIIALIATRLRATYLTCFTEGTPQ